MLLDPFILFGRMFLASFLVLGYVVVGIVEAIWYASTGRRDRIGAAIGATGRSIMDTVGHVFRK
jgi:hypothetical protein